VSTGNNHKLTFRSINVISVTENLKGVGNCRNNIRIAGLFKSNKFGNNNNKPKFGKVVVSFILPAVLLGTFVLIYFVASHNFLSF